MLNEAHTQNIIDISTLKNFPFFSKLEETELQKLANMIRKKNLPSNTVLFKQNHSSDLVYFITSGHVKVYIIDEEGKEINLALVGKNEVLGEISVTLMKDSVAYCESVDDIEFYIMNGSDFLQVLENNPKISMEFLKYYMGRLLKSNDYIQNIFTRNLEERALALLKLLTKENPKKQVDITQEEIASILSATRPRVTEALEKLDLAGRIAVSRGSIKVL